MKLSTLKIVFFFIYKLLFLSVFRTFFFKTLQTFLSVNKHKLSDFSSEVRDESLTDRYLNDNIIVHSLNEDESAVNLILWDVAPNKIFGGIATIIKSAKNLNDMGYAIRIISLQNAVSLVQKNAVRKVLKEKFNFEHQFVDKIEIFSKKDDFENVISRNDIFIATFWPTAYFIQNTIKHNNLLNKYFVYFIQDFEPGFYPWSSSYQLAYNTYKLPVIPIFNSSFLADFFQKQPDLNLVDCIVLKPEINFKLYSPPSIEFLGGKEIIRIVVYGRETIDRNLFEFITSSLKIWIGKYKPSNAKIELCSIGVEHETYDFGSGFKLKSKGKMSLDEYADFLKSCDIGLSLMLSPHPSYPPLEMAASGMLVITNNYVNKNLSFLSKNIHSVDCDPTIISEEIQICLQKVGNFEQRISESYFEDKLAGDELSIVCEKIVERFKEKEI